MMLNRRLKSTSLVFLSLFLFALMHFLCMDDRKINIKKLKCEIIRLSLLLNAVKIQANISRNTWQFMFIERFGNFQISLRSHELISVTRFPIKSAVSVKWTYLERRQKFGYWNSYATELFSASSGHWPCLSFVDRFFRELVNSTCETRRNYVQ